MKLRLSVTAPNGMTKNLRITADATATVGDVAAGLAGAGPVRAAEPVDPRSRTLEVLAPGGPLGATRRTGASLGGGSGRLLDPDLHLNESGLRSGAVVGVRAVAATRENNAEEGAVVLVLSGPHAGESYSVPLGATEIGRSSQCGISLSRDPLVSKHHLRLTVGAQVEVTDLNSANGLLIGDERVTKQTVTSADVVTVGDSTLRITRLVGVSEMPGVTDTTDVGHIRSPRVVPRTPEVKVTLPAAPQQEEKARFPLLAMIAPLVMGAFMYLMTRNVMSIVFVALSPLIMIGTWVDQRIRRRRMLKHSTGVFMTALAKARSDIKAAHARERVARLAQYPSTEEVLTDAESLGPRLWSRRPEHPEFLQLRLGIGSEVPRTEVEGMDDATALPVHQEMIQEVRAVNDRIVSVPVVANLREDGSLGVAGRRDRLDGVSRALVAQLIALHSPAELALVCLTDRGGRDRWSWLEWIPHTASPHSPIGPMQLACDTRTGTLLVARLEELIAQRGRDGTPGLRGPAEHEGDDEGDEPTVPAVVVLVDGTGADRARLTRIVEQGPDVGVHVIWVADHVESLPAACRTFVEVGESACRVGFVRRSMTSDIVVVETLDAQRAAGLGRFLAPVVDAGVPVDDESDLPGSISYIGLTGAELADDPDAQVVRWRANHSVIDRAAVAPLKRPVSLAALVGQGAEGPLALDLRVHGPHALVGGTTGAGKSEFLQSWVLGMAQALSPDRVTFLFVDYKGGSAFARCTDLPHSVGIVTDLSPAMVRRALTSLRAELRHREHLLNDKGAKDLVTLEKKGDPQCPPSLVIVVDEFAALVSEVPEFVDGVVDVAQRGRSLGLHLILATQRPAGVIKDNLRANTNLRVALRMADETDSQDVLGEKTAAHFPPEIPGRAAAKTGPGRITQFQSAYPGARTSAQTSAAQVAVEEMTFGVPRPWQVPRREVDTGNVRQDIDRVVDTMARAAELAGIRPPRKPWLPELAACYDLNRLTQKRDTDIVLGIVDDPDNQDQHPEYFHPDDKGNIVFYGASGSGKSTALRSLAIAAAITPESGPVDVYAIDAGGGSLGMLEALPHVGAVIDSDDVERVQRLLTRLARIVDERSERYSAARAGTLTEYRQISDGAQEPRILLLVDGIGAWREACERSSDGQDLLDVFTRLLVDGRAVGVHVAASAERPQSVPSSMTSSFLHKVVLRQSDEEGYLYFGLPKDVLSPTSPPGRCMQVGSGQELQLAVFGGDGNVLAQARKIEEFAHYLEANGRRRPEPVGFLPAELSPRDLARTVDGLPVIGMGAESLGPVGFEPTGTLLVAGPPQSGTTNALRWIATSIKEWDSGVVLVRIAPRRSPLDGVQDLWESTASTEEGIREILDLLDPSLVVQAEPGRPTIALFIEGCQDIIQTPLETPVTDAVSKIKRNGHLVVAEGDISAWNSMWSLPAEMRAARTGLLLQPDSSDGSMILRTDTPRVRQGEMPIGRGFWIHASKATKVQVPFMDT